MLPKELCPKTVTISFATKPLSGTIFGQHFGHSFGASDWGCLGTNYRRCLTIKHLHGQSRQVLGNSLRKALGDMIASFAEETPVRGDQETFKQSPPQAIPDARMLGHSPRKTNSDKILQRQYLGPQSQQKHQVRAPSRITEVVLQLPS